MAFVRASLAALIVCFAGVAFAQASEVGRLEGFALPESGAYDPGTGMIFVSNIASDPSATDGAGFISTIDAEGTSSRATG